MGAIAREEVEQLYAGLVGMTFDGTHTGSWESEHSLDPQPRDVIVTPKLEEQLQKKLTNMDERLEGQVWKGFIPNGSGWKFFVILDGEQNIGDAGRYTIIRCEIFTITEQRQKYASRMGVSITLKLS